MDDCEQPQKEGFAALLRSPLRVVKMTALSSPDEPGRTAGKGRARRCSCPGRRGSGDQAWAGWGWRYINATSTRECGFRVVFAAECRRMRPNAGSQISRYQRLVG